MPLNATIYKLFNYLLINIYTYTQSCFILIYINIDSNKNYNVITFLLFGHLLQWFFLTDSLKF